MSQPNADFTLATAERRAIVRAMREAVGVKTVAAKLLGCGKSTLYRKLREHAVTVAEYLAHASTPTPPTPPREPPAASSPSLG